MVKHTEHKDHFEEVVEIIQIYCQSDHKLHHCFTDYVIPIFRTILERGIDTRHPDNIGEINQLSKVFKLMVESLNFFLINESDKAKILEKLEDLCSFIHDLVKQEHVLIEFR